MVVIFLMQAVGDGPINVDFVKVVLILLLFLLRVYALRDRAKPFTQTNPHGVALIGVHHVVS